MLTNDKKALIAMDGEAEISIRPEMINRHGLIAGATGTGKTVSLQTLAETFSQLGVPTLVADIKGDLSGVAKAGSGQGKPAERAKDLKLPEKGYQAQEFPVRVWDVLGKTGTPLRATISDVGPLLLARLLNLTDAQAGVLQIVFRIADDNGLLLLDLKDLRSMIQQVSEERERYKAQYGLVSPASAAAITRGLLKLEQEGAESFFGEPALDIMDLIQTENGKGVINLLDATQLVNSPSLYACALLWLLSELYERLPERGDQPLPRLALFLDEAHLLFDNMDSGLLQKIEQVVRLIRSRGVGIYFISQSPSDIPDSILGQLGNRVQHALRAFTPKDQKAVRAASEAFRPNPAFSTADAISNLSIGEALVSFLDASGAPEIVRRALIVPPQSQVGPLTDSDRKEIIAKSPLMAKYGQALDRESAYEILSERAASLQAEKEQEEQAKAWEKARKEAEKQLREQERTQRRDERAQKAEAKRLLEEAKRNDPLGALLGGIASQAARGATNALAREIGKAVFGKGIGGAMGTRILRGALGGLLGKR